MPDDSLFPLRFEALTGHGPFPWQVEMFNNLLQGEIPETCDLPTGLGKTSLIPIWLLALAKRGPGIPRRLVYVVNRRTVVDQSTAQAEQIRAKLLNFEAGDPPPRPEIIAARRDVTDALRRLSFSGNSDPLAISTLRGQFADNRAWSADPSRPAVIVGTVDMIGSRLLFGGYSCGFKTRPLHAGFLGHDALLIHDEAHLEPAFQRLIEAIAFEQRQEQVHGSAPLDEALRLRIMELTATPRGDKKLFSLTSADRVHPEVVKRIHAKKLLNLVTCPDYKNKLADQLVECAVAYQDTNQAVIVFARTIETVGMVADKLKKVRDVLILTGTMRGREREELFRHSVFQRFKPGFESSGPTVYLVCTSAGEVGINISADHLVCDLSTFDSMAQRFGRVNRFGERNDTQIDVVHPEDFDQNKDPLADRLEMTLNLLQKLAGSASPAALGSLDPGERFAAFSPSPPTLLTSDILFDVWSMTSICDDLPGRPPLEPYLRGITEPEHAETQVAWRDEVHYLSEPLRTDEQRRLLDVTGKGHPHFLSKPLWTDEQRAEFLEDFPLKPHEWLCDRSSRVFRYLEELARRDANQPVWLVDRQGRVESLRVDRYGGLHPLTIKDLADKERKDRINGRTILLPPDVGGLSNGLLDGRSTARVHDISEHVSGEGALLRRRIWDDRQDESTKEMRLIRAIDTKLEGDGSAGDDDPPDQDMDEGRNDGEPSRRWWQWYERPRSADGEGSESAKEAVLWDVHTEDVYHRAKAIVAGLTIPDEVKRVVVLAAFLHDLGKLRPIFQRVIGNNSPHRFLAKSGRKQRGGDYGVKFRHEFGSLLDLDKLLQTKGSEPIAQLVSDLAMRLGYDLQGELDWLRQDDNRMELAQHLIATHHGRARPHFLTDEVFDPGHPRSVAVSAGSAVPRRFARLQRRYGRWGLAYLESLLRAADYAASADPSRTVEDPS